MSYFYGWLRGNRGGTHRCGSKGSGITATVQSWNSRADVRIYADDDGQDVININAPATEKGVREVYLNGKKVRV